MITGCPGNNEVKVPSKQIELPKEGPKAAGSGKAGSSVPAKAVD